MDSGDKQIEQEFEKVADEMQVKLPGTGLPPILRFIALFMFAGGLSILGSIFADIVNPTQTHISFYLLRIIVGGVVIATAYGIVKLARWALWIYGAAILIGLIVNPVVVALPATVLIFLFMHREKFTPSIFDHKLNELISFLKKEKVQQPPQG